MGKPADRAFQRSFRLIDPSTVVVTIASKQTHYSVGIHTAYGFDGTPEDVVALRAGRELLHVTVARDGSAMCHCNLHFEANGCWHADLAVAIVKHLAASTVLSVEDGDGKPPCDIVSESGLCASHRKLAALIRSKPHLICDREQLESLERLIAGTRIRIVA